MKTVFVRDSKSLTDLQAGHGTYTYETAFTVSKIIELTPQQYNTFTENLLGEYAYITENKAMMFVDINHVWHCLLIREPNSKSGILVLSEANHRWFGFEQVKKSGKDC